MWVSKHTFGIAGEKYLYLSMQLLIGSPRGCSTPPAGAAAPDLHLQPLEREATGEDGRGRRGSARHPGSLAPPPTQPASASDPGQEAGEGALVAPLQTWDLCSLSYTPTQSVRGREGGWVSTTSCPILFYFILCYFIFLDCLHLPLKDAHIWYVETLLRLCLRLNQRGKGELASKCWTTKPLISDADENND